MKHERKVLTDIESKKAELPTQDLREALRLYLSLRDGDSFDPNELTEIAARLRSKADFLDARFNDIALAASFNNGTEMEVDPAHFDFQPN